MRPGQLIDRFRRRPSDLLTLKQLAFWNGRLTEEQRRAARRAAERYVEIVPWTVDVPAHLRDADLEPAIAWTRRLRAGSSAETVATRARFLENCARTQRTPRREFIDAAWRLFDRLPRHEKRRWPVLWFGLANEAGNEVIDRDFEFIVKSLIAKEGRTGGFEGNYIGLRLPGVSSGRRRPPNWQDRIDRIAVKAPLDLLSFDYRLHLIERDGLAAFERNAIAGVRKAFLQLKRLLPYSGYPGNHVRLVRAALERRILESECIGILDLALKREWRSWVRTELVAIRTRAVAQQGSMPHA